MRVQGNAKLVAVNYYLNKQGGYSSVFSLLNTDGVQASIEKLFIDCDFSMIGYLNDLTDLVKKKYIDCQLSGEYNTKYVKYDSLVCPMFEIVNGAIILKGVAK